MAPRSRRAERNQPTSVRLLEPSPVGCNDETRRRESERVGESRRESERVGESRRKSERVRERVIERVIERES